MAPQRQSLRQKQALKQTTSLQTIQFMKLLEMPTNRLEDEVRKALEENPALEIEPDVSYTEKHENDFEQESSGTGHDDEVKELTSESVITDDDYEDFFGTENYEDDNQYREEHQYNYDYGTMNNRSQDGNTRETIVVNDFSLQEDLLFQLSMQNISEREKTIAEYLIGNLDESGYLTQDNKTFASDLLLTYNIYTTPEEVERIITSCIQQLDPPGVGARSLKECLSLQLKKCEQIPATILAATIIDKCFEEFSKKHYEKIMNQLHINESQLKEALHEIQKLDPSPAFTLSRDEHALSYINPDFTITADGDRLQLHLNTQYIPRLQINSDFKNQYAYLNTERNIKKRAEAERFIKDNVENAQNFINTLSQREMTLYNTMWAIMQKQHAYFLSGNDMDLKPMILKDIAEEVGLDISTISRVSNSKYVQTPFGIIPLKHLFSESIGSEDISSRKVKTIIGDLIEKEDKNAPLTDDQLCAALQEKGFHIARRTVAKYREQSGFPVARLRKRI